MVAGKTEDLGIGRTMRLLVQDNAAALFYNWRRAVHDDIWSTGYIYVIVLFFRIAL